MINSKRLLKDSSQSSRGFNETCYKLKFLKLDKRINYCIKVNIRELDRELHTRLSILYTNT